MKTTHNLHPRNEPFKTRSKTRDALSVLEAVGAIAAVSAGLWLGAAYLDVNLRDAWNMAANKTGLEQFAVVEDVEKDGAAPATHGDAGEIEVEDEFDVVESPRTTSEATVKANGERSDSENLLDAEIDELREALRRLEESKDDSAVGHDNGDQEHAEIENREVDTGSEKKIAAVTLKYWNTLNKIMLKEERMREAPDGGLTAENAGGFLAGRGKAARFAAEAISNLKTTNVDPEVASHARTIAQWYEQGAKLNDQATYLFSKADPATRRGPLGKQWSTAEKQHQNEVQIINSRSESVRKNMSEKYGVAFPKLR